MKGSTRSRYPQAATGALLLSILACPPMRHLLEGGMGLHMLVQYPVVILSGALLVQSLPSAMTRRLAGWNVMGLAGLAATLLIISVLMIPRVLDLALTDPRVEVGKVAALVVVGAALRSSWRQAGLVVQAFFLGIFVPMTIAVGSLYQDTPLRLCNAYRLDDQHELGRWLIYAAVALAVVWSIRAGRAAIARDSDEILLH